MSLPAKQRLTLLVLVIAPTILFASIVFAGKVLYWGTPALQFVPWRYFAIESITSGQMPLWNPWLGMGSPLIANYQSALFYPPNWFVILMGIVGGVGWLAWGQSILVVAHIILAAIGVFFLARRLGMGMLAQIVSSLAYSLCGYLVARAGFLSINAATPYLPWVLLFVTELVGRQEQTTSSPYLSQFLKSLVSLVIVFSLLFLAGHAQTAWYIIIFTVIWAAFWGWWSKDRGTGQGSKVQDQLRLRLGGTSRSVLWVLLAVVIASAITAIQLLPTFEYLLQSQRADAVEMEYTMTYSFWPWRFLTLFAPDFFGNPVNGNYWGYGNYWEDALYIGVLAMIMALSAIFWWLYKRLIKLIGKETETRTIDDLILTRSRMIGLLVGIIIMAFILALGKYTPIFPWLYKNIPTFDLFQAPTRVTIWVELALALLAGYGLDSWKRPVKRGLYWTRLGTAGALAITFGAGIGWVVLGQNDTAGIRSPTFIEATAVMGLWLFGTGILSLTAPKSSYLEDRLRGQESQEISIWGWGVVLLVAIDLIYAGWGLNPVIDKIFYTQPNLFAQDVRENLDGGRLFLWPESEVHLKYERFLRFDRFNPGEDWMNMRSVLLPNLTILDGIQSANNFDPLVPMRYSQWMEASEKVDRETAEEFLNLMGVGVVEIKNESKPLGVEFNPVGNRQPKRVRWVPCAVWVKDGETALGMMMTNLTDYNLEVILEADGTRDKSDCNPGRISDGVITQSIAPNEITVSVDSSNDGWVFLADTWYPGWQVYMDGKPEDQYRANFLFRAVPVKAGIHEVKWVYQPLTFRAGVFLSVLTAVLLFGYICFAVFSKKS